MRSKLLLAAAVVSLLLTHALPASAQNTGLNLNILAGSLAISVPAAAGIGHGLQGETIAGPIGNVTVTDDRAALTATWTASVASGGFTTGSGTPEETIPNSAVRYWSGAAVQSTGFGTLIPGQAIPAQAVVLNTQRTAFSLAAGTGTNTATWNPTVEISIPASAMSGPYTGTVTHTVL